MRRDRITLRERFQLRHWTPLDAIIGRLRYVVGILVVNPLGLVPAAFVLFHGLALLLKPEVSCSPRCFFSNGKKHPGLSLVERQMRPCCPGAIPRKVNLLRWKLINLLRWKRGRERLVA
jgi:hypothetical protein